MRTRGSGGANATLNGDWNWTNDSLSNSRLAFESSIRSAPQAGSCRLRNTPA
jgi:hypothetical protein